MLYVFSKDVIKWQYLGAFCCRIDRCSIDAMISSFNLSEIKNLM